MSSNRTAHAHGADYETADEDYFKHRQLRRGAASWVLLAGPGVAYVICGDFAGWNFGLAQGGWGGLTLATDGETRSARALQSRRWRSV